MGFKIKLYHLMAVHAIFGTIRQNIEQYQAGIPKHSRITWNDS